MLFIVTVLWPVAVLFYCVSLLGVSNQVKQLAKEKEIKTFELEQSYESQAQQPLAKVSSEA